MANQERKTRRKKAKAKKKAEGGSGKVTVTKEKTEDDGGSEEANLDHDNGDECLVSFAVSYFGFCGCKCYFFISYNSQLEEPLFGAEQVGYPRRWKR
jgi:hypothetical protein